MEIALPAAGVTRQILEQAEALERVTAILQESQDALPPPDPEEVALLREGGSLSVAAFLGGLLQRVIVSVENAASDLRTGVDAETLAVLDQMRPSAAEINSIESALMDRLQRNVQGQGAASGGSHV
ncbi:MAG TPA: hypothetical protein VEW48_18170 [Thermoanaerobaculia bacterium]|nr:hypothetical protein [Thermoanaerobaculia bacterium]